jgi:hypothetical protein
VKRDGRLEATSVLECHLPFFLVGMPQIDDGASPELPFWVGPTVHPPGFGRNRGVAEMR